VTAFSDMDYDIKLGGKMGDVKNEYQMTFVFKVDKSENSIFVYSEMYEDLHIKNLMKDCINIILDKYFPIPK
jgi:hypothetical protein